MNKTINFNVTEEMIIFEQKVRTLMRETPLSEDFIASVLLKLEEEISIT
tara:strand:+ start:601 stop:747 length:147 start_codon:yes stop_codon:yes gene_type:complete